MSGYDSRGENAPYFLIESSLLLKQISFRKYPPPSVGSNSRFLQHGSVLCTAQHGSGRSFPMPGTSGRAAGRDPRQSLPARPAGPGSGSHSGAGAWLRPGSCAPPGRQLRPCSAGITCPLGGCSKMPPPLRWRERQKQGSAMLSRGLLGLVGASGVHRGTAGVGLAGRGERRLAQVGAPRLPVLGAPGLPSVSRPTSDTRPPPASAAGPARPGRRAGAGVGERPAGGTAGSPPPAGRNRRPPPPPAALPSAASPVAAGPAHVFPLSPPSVVMCRLFCLQWKQFLALGLAPRRTAARRERGAGVGQSGPMQAAEPRAPGPPRHPRGSG